MPRIGPGAALRLALVRGREHVRRRVDERGGFARLVRRSAGEVMAWWHGEDEGGLTPRAWLERPGAGRLWVAPGDAEAWAAATWTPADQELAEAAAAGVFDLAGSGPVALGTPPRWRRDLYAGVEWPLEPSSRLGLQRGDGSDIRTVWELSRFYHVPALARAYWKTGDPRHARLFLDHAASFAEQNPVGRGPHWKSPMDVALRACNWALGLTLFAEAPVWSDARFRALLAQLIVSGHFVERYLEWHPRYRGNHYVANLVGLLYLGALFRDRSWGRRWYARARLGLEREIRYQVTPEGVSFEASLGYHRLVLELFGWAAAVVAANPGGSVSEEYRQRLGRMGRFLHAYLPPSGEAPMIGDADDGRVHWVSAVAARNPRRHAEGLPAGEDLEVDGNTCHAGGGFYVLRTAGLHGVIRCGPVGLRGAGSHDHNDQLGFELVVRGRRIVSDSGTFCYTRDLAARHAFRATAAHSVFQVGGEEQNPIRADRPWRVLRDRTRARATDWSVGSGEVLFEGVHRGYAHRPSGATVYRRVRATATAWHMEDRIEGRAREDLVWRLHLTPAPVQVIEEREGYIALDHGGSPSVRIAVSHPPALRHALRSSPASDGYGERHDRPCLELTGSAALPVCVTTVVE